LPGSDSRVSVIVVDVAPGREPEYARLARELDALLRRKEYGWHELIQDQLVPSRFYDIRHWASAQAAELCHHDPDVRAIWQKLDPAIDLRLTHLVDLAALVTEAGPIVERRRGGDRRTGLDRRVRNVGRAEGDRRLGTDRRVGPRRATERAAGDRLVARAREAREQARATFSGFKVGAALETADGRIITGCNIENATYGLTICAERVAVFKALSEGYREFKRIAVVADTEEPASPCGPCRQILWEFGGNLEVILANLHEEQGTFWLKDLLPLPFDARLLGKDR
jgi:cytidine deaminase